MPRYMEEVHLSHNRLTAPRAAPRLALLSPRRRSSGEASADGDGMVLVAVTVVAVIPNVRKESVNDDVHMTMVMVVAG